MLKLTLTAKDSPVTVHDPRPITQNNEEVAVISVQPNSSVTALMQWAQLERIQRQIVDLAALGLLEYAIESGDYVRPDGKVITVAAFAEQPDADTNPAIDLVTGQPSAGSGSTGILVTGTNLLAGQTFASVSLVSEAGDANSLDIAALLPGSDGNAYSAEVVDTGAGGLAVTITTGVDAKVSVDLGGATPNIAAVKAALEAESDFTDTFVATVTGADTALQATQELANLDGGVGSGLSISIGGAPCVVTAIDLSGDPIQVITIDTPVVGTAADVARVLLRSDSKEDIASVALIA